MLTRIACLLIVTSPFLAVGQSPGQQVKGGPAELQGTWKLVSIEVGGEVIDFTDRQPRLIIQGNKVQYAGEDLALLSVDAGTPKNIDLNFLSTKRMYEGIYQLDKDTLKVCVNRQTDGVKERPEGFSTKDKETWRLMVFERDKAAKPNAKEGLSGFVGVALSFDKDQQKVSVGSVIEGSPAQKAGLRAKDVILKIGGENVTDLRGAVEAVRKTLPDVALTFHILRDGKESDITVTVGVLPFAFLALLE
jgi:uncharacterized protein (TIGR03067 family)